MLRNPNPVPEELKFTPFPEQPPPSKKTKYTLILILGLIMLLLFGITLFFLIKGNEDKILALTHLTPEMLVTTQKQTPEIKEARIILENLQKDLKTNKSIKEFKYNDWVMPDKTKTFIKGYTFSIEQTATPSGDLIESLNTKSMEYFLSYGFGTNILNSVDFNQNETLPSGKVAYTKAYERNGLFCVSNFNDLNANFAVFYCGIIDEEQNKLQNTVGKELSTLLNPENDPAVLVLIQRLDGDLAVGVINQADKKEILVFYTKKINGKWKIIEKSSEGLSCSVAKKYNLAPEYQNNCIKYL
jgi:hypothetical protein